MLPPCTVWGGGGGQTYRQDGGGVVRGTDMIMVIVRNNVEYLRRG